MIAVIILAAGGSFRLGRAKQSLKYNGKTLLQHTVDAAVNAAIGPVTIVVGANEEEVCAGIEKDNLQVITNEHWKEGMASSIKAGLSHAVSLNSNIEAAILMVCDQPFINAEILQTLVETKQETNKKIVACFYKDTVGVPALFHQDFFPDLLSLKDDEGGKKVLKMHPDSVAVIPFPAGEIDIDTSADYDALIG